MKAATDYEMKGLPGVSGALGGIYKDTRTGFMALIGTRINGHHHRLITSSRSNGSVSVWIDDDGKFQCGAYRLMTPMDRQTFTTKKAVNAWLKTWLPEIQ